MGIQEILKTAKERNWNVRNHLDLPELRAGAFLHPVPGGAADPDGPGGSHRVPGTVGRELMHATHVVADTHDGTTFWFDDYGTLFDEDSAIRFAQARNDEMKPEHRKYRVFTLVPDEISDAVVHYRKD
jgi:hypothetical protein